MSRSVSCTLWCISSRMPYGTEGLGYNVAGGILIPIHHQCTGRTDVGAHAQTLLDERTTPTTMLTGEVGGNFDDLDRMQRPIIVHLGEELPPFGIIDGFR